MEMKHQVTETRLRKTILLEAKSLLSWCSLARCGSCPKDNLYCLANQRRISFDSCRSALDTKDLSPLPTSFPRRSPPDHSSATAFLFSLLTSEDRLSSVRFGLEDFSLSLASYLKPFQHRETILRPHVSSSEATSGLQQIPYYPALLLG